MAEFELKFEKITSVDDSRWEFIERLFVEAFPPDERREFSLQRHLAANDPRFTQCVVVDKEQPVAIISYWILEEGNYFEHVATSPDVRGGGLGAAIVKHLIARVAPSWFGEVELPLDELCRRRIGFYERLGFVGHPSFPYSQPPYSNDNSPVPMMIMTVGDKQVTQEKLTKMTSELVRTVYSIGV